jgi:hypothetical protein
MASVGKINLRFELGRHLLVRVADADGHDAPEKVQILPPLEVINVMPFGMINHQRVFVIGGDALPQMRLMLLNDFIFGQGVPRRRE